MDVVFFKGSTPDHVIAFTGGTWFEFLKSRLAVGFGNTVLGEPSRLRWLTNGVASAAPGSPWGAPNGVYFTDPEGSVKWLTSNALVKPPTENPWDVDVPVTT